GGASEAALRHPGASGRCQGREGGGSVREIREAERLGEIALPPARRWADNRRDRRKSPGKESGAMRPANLADWTLEDYERAAEEYCASLPLEHFMEAIGQSTQRKISWESLDLIAARRGNMQVFNELLVQYP